jgi:WD40 repeat protein
VVATLTASVVFSVIAGAVIASVLAIKANTLAQREAEQRGLAETGEAVARRTAYAAGMNLADLAFRDGHGGRVLQLLENQVPPQGKSDLRGFEWYELSRRLQDDLRTFRGDFGPIGRVAFAADGRRLAVSGKGSVKVLDTVDGKVLLTFGDGAGCMAVSPDGRLLAAPCGQDVVKVFDSMNGREHLVLKDHPGVGAIAFSSDGRLLAIACSREVRGEDLMFGGIPSHIKIWDLSKEKLIHTLEDPSQITCMAFHGQLIASGAYSPGLRVHKVGSGKLIGVWQLGAGGLVTGVCFSPDGKRHSALISPTYQASSRRNSKGA